MQKNKKLLERIKKVSGGYGKTFYLRLYQEDEKIIEEISQATGEKHFQIAAKLIHVAITGGQVK